MVGTFFSPFSGLLSLQQALESAMDDSFWGSTTSRRGGYPLFNVFRKGETYILKSELPGLKKDELTLEIRDNAVRIAGERRPDFTPNEVSVHRGERSFGRFDRTIKLPVRVDSNKANAEYKNGVLTVTMQQIESDKPRKVSIN